MVNFEGFITISELLPLPDNTLARYLVKVISGLFDESRSERLTIINRATGVNIKRRLVIYLSRRMFVISDLRYEICNNRLFFRDACH